MRAGVQRSCVKGSSTEAPLEMMGQSLAQENAKRNVERTDEGVRRSPQIRPEREYFKGSASPFQTEAEQTAGTCIQEGQDVPLASPDAAYQQLCKAPYHKHPDPLHFFGAWPLQGLSAESVRRIQIGLLEIHRDSVQGIDVGREYAYHVRWCLRAYNIVATELWNAGNLTEDLVNNQIPQVVFDASMTAYWFRSYPGSALRVYANQIRFARRGRA